MLHADAYKDRQKGLTYKEIAKKYGVTVSAVKSWANRYWKVATSNGKVATKRGKVATKKVGAPKGNKNAVGHGPPKQNSNALLHGLYSKYLPKETLEIVMEVQEASPIDILWSNIQIKFAAIIRAQQLMYVKDVDDHLEFEQMSSATSVGENSFSETDKKETKIITSLEREEKFLNAQSRAMDTLTRMIKQYDELCQSPLATEEQKYRIDKLKTEVEVMKLKDDVEEVQDITPYVNALSGRVEEAWSESSSKEKD